jgi:hypothetical protein
MAAARVWCPGGSDRVRSSTRVDETAEMCGELRKWGRWEVAVGGRWV